MRFFGALTIFFLLFPNSTFARNLIIMGVEKEPMRFVNDGGQFTGIDIEIIDHIFNKLGVKYKIQLLKSSPRLKSFWKKEQPQVDMVLTYSHKTSREKYLIYAKESHLNIKWNFFILNKNLGKINFKKFDDLKGLTVGATTDYAYTSEFWSAGEQELFKLEKNPCNELQIKKLLAERFDTVPLQTIAALYQAKKEGYSDIITYLPKPLKQKPYYNTFVKASDYKGLDQLIKNYDEKLREMKNAGILQKIYEKYGISYDEFN